jgi:hypothetical protein
MSTVHKKLEPFYKFFESYGVERLKGLDESYLAGLNESEKEEAWNFLKDGFYLSDERIGLLYALDKLRAVELFKKVLSEPIPTSDFAAEREAFERNRLLMLKYIVGIEHDEKYIDEMNGFAHSQFCTIRGEFAQSLPVQKANQSSMEALKGMIFTETERIPLVSAIVKFMSIYQMDYDLDDPLYKSIYLSLRSDDQKEKIAGVKRLEMRKLSDEL